jgi:hypothetical protein
LLSDDTLAKRLWDVSERIIAAQLNSSVAALQAAA